MFYKNSGGGKTKKGVDYEFYIQMGIIVLLGVVLLYGAFKPVESSVSGLGVVSASEIIPSGVPPVYGEELGIKYDFVSPDDRQLADQTIRFLGNIDRSEKLEGADLERYINILYKMNNGIACEYCCGARSVIFENGQPACGCAHSYAMRGVAKYLIKYHGDEFSDEEILEEVSKWKILFFPGIIQGKADIMRQNGLDVDYISVASNKYRGIERGKASGGMVGGC